MDTKNITPDSLNLFLAEFTDAGVALAVAHGIELGI
jgi:hypothetical protein